MATGSIIEQLSPAMQHEYETLIGPIARSAVVPSDGPESFAAFARRQGEYVKVVDVGIRSGEPSEAFLFLSGAVSDGQLDHREPSEDIWTRIAAQRRYLTERIRQEVVAFNRAKNEYLEAASLRQRYGNVPGPPADAADQLARGRDKIVEYRRKLERLPEKPKTEREVARERMQEERAMEDQRTIDAIRRVVV